LPHPRSTLFPYTTLFRSHLQVSKRGPSDFVSKADMRSERILYDELLKVRPGWGFVLEEGGMIEGEEGKPRWIIDPLDGSTNFLRSEEHTSELQSRENLVC